MEHDWPAKNYAIGAYIQATAADNYLRQFNPNPDERILDIGCGDGSYSLKILEFIPHGQLVGIDSSESMLSLARQKSDQIPDFRVQNYDVIDMPYSNEFDHVVSFWCLQWSDNIVKAFESIHQALKPKGRVFTLFPSGDDPFMKSFQAVKNSGQFKELDSFCSKMHYDKLTNLAQRLRRIPFSKLEVKQERNSIEIPNLEIFRRFIYGIGFFQGQVPDELIPTINDAMIQWFDNYCHKNHNGQYLFEFSPYWITGEK